MALTNILGALASASGDASLGYAKDKEEALSRALRERQESRQTSQDAVSRRLSEAQMRRLDAAAFADMNPRQPEIGPLEVVVGPDGKRTYAPRSAAVGQPAPEPVAPSAFSFPTGTDGEGKPVVLRANNRTGDVEPTDVGARPGAGGAIRPPTEAQEKSHLFFNLMKNAQPEIDAALATNKVRPDMISLQLRSGPVDFLTNRLLNAEEQQLLRAARDFTAGVLRKESGAAVTNTELLEALNRYIPLSGDLPELSEAKRKARDEYMGVMEQSASPASRYYDSTKRRPAGASAAATPGAPIPSYEDWLAKRGGGE